MREMSPQASFSTAKISQKKWLMILWPQKGGLQVRLEWRRELAACSPAQRRHPHARVPAHELWSSEAAGRWPHGHTPSWPRARHSMEPQRQGQGTSAGHTEGDVLELVLASMRGNYRMPQMSVRARLRGRSMGVCRRGSRARSVPMRRAFSAHS